MIMDRRGKGEKFFVMNDEFHKTKGGNRNNKKNGNKGGEKDNKNNGRGKGNGRG
jgi:hypothetical protein